MLSFLFFFFSSKGTKVFCKLKLHVLRLENIAYNWLDPGLNLITFRGTGHRKFYVLHGTIRKDDSYCNTALQCWNNIVTIRNNVATMLQGCVALKIVVANRLV